MKNPNPPRQQKQCQQEQWQREHQFIEFSQQTLAPFWQTRNEGFISGEQGKQLYWVSFTKKENTKAIFVVNGRIESAYKYQELFWDLTEQGYDVYSYDHRGQGMSERCCDDRQIGHVEHFDHYIQDMHHVVTAFDFSRYDKSFILAHSMGGAISTRYIQTHPDHPFDAIALSAPMIGIQMQWYLRPFSAPLTKWMAARSPLPNYAPGQKAYVAKPFTNNHLTHSELRYQWFRDLYDRQPEIQLGGPSSHWVNQSLLAAKRCSLEVEKITIPVLLMQAGQDTIVDNAAQRRFIKKLNLVHHGRGQLEIINGARHELLFESDELRVQALQLCLDFFAQH
ncbi:alpha/beta fold hydrolase [Vibrio gangliei]|uniref:alpha/beta fold hydrolase n=1 Tax=Vibrio gangliei TaxID=2077090 RepID=UPI000D01DD56|nr:alpha/beta fold hydrolase [Vibrio gangliei]